MAPIRLNRKHGFTLLEMLVSSGLFILVWASLVGSIMVGKMVEVRARHRMQATYAAQQIMAQMQKQAYYKVVYISQENAIPILLDAQEGFSGKYYMFVTPMPPIPNTEKIDVTVTWDEPLARPGRTKRIQERLSTYITWEG